MKILKIIHGYPPLYNAGSEVYSQLLCHGLTAAQHEVHVLSREENPFAADFKLRHTVDAQNPAIQLHLVNIPSEKFRYRYTHPVFDPDFIMLLHHIKPDIVHVGHLNHLSLSLVQHITAQHIPIVYTLHDYWLMCPRGQFIQRNAPNLWALCDGQNDTKCATQCYAGYFSGVATEDAMDTEHWTGWIHRRMVHIQDMVNQVHCFIAPSQYLYQRYLKEFHLPEKKMVYLDYGFDLNRLKFRTRTPKEPFTFGYIGTHIPSKGIQDLISAMARLKGHCQLRIWGRPQAQNTEGLRALISHLPTEIQDRIEWRSEYRNDQIVSDVFNHVDCIVVPSIWVENSPLVIHEALQVRIPVITANVGGMAEYVQHEKNGLLFEHRNSKQLAHQMQRCLDNPEWAAQLGQRGYLQSASGDIPSLESHIAHIETIYSKIYQEAL
jgi:glycosyltransferase involved in cell wall biosynthesis